MRTRLYILALTLALFVGAALPSRADGLIIPYPPPNEPTAPVALAVKYHHVTATIRDQVATTHVDQVFVNDSDLEIEGEYLFPLPAGSSVSSFAMWVDGRRLEAQVLDADEARAVYEEIVRRRRDPALLEYAGQNAYRLRIYPIAAHGEVRVEIEYSEVLAPLDGLVRYSYPLGTEKLSPRPLEEVTIDVEIEAAAPLRALYSPTHAVATTRDGDRRAQVSYHDENVLPEGDFVLYYGQDTGELAANLLSYRTPGEDGYFLLLVIPPERDAAETVVDRDVFLVLDVSGSMRGDKLEQARRAAIYVLDQLNPGDRYNIVAFSTATQVLSAAPLPAAERDAGYRFLAALSAGGGTNIGRALEETLAQADGERPAAVLLITDGLPTEGEQRAEQILADVVRQAAEGVRLFSFGVGDDVNTVLLDSLASAQQGTSVYVRPDEDIEPAVAAFYTRIGMPVLADLTVDVAGARFEDTYPYPLPDLFAGEQLVLVGRYSEPGEVTLTLGGTANGETLTYTFGDLSLAERGGADFVPRLWATRKVGHLLTEIRLHGADEELVDEVVALSVRYGIVTPYTSFLVDETEDALTEEGRDAIAEREVAAAPQPTIVSGLGGAPLAVMPEAAGAEAVDKSVAQGAMRDAERAAPAGDSGVRAVGDRAFVRRDGQWIDTTYDPAAMEAEAVQFGSARYFELLRQYPGWGPYLALGDRLILVWEGRAYRIDADGASAALGSTPPAATPTATAAATATTGTTATATPTAAPTATPAAAAAVTPGALPEARPAGLWEMVVAWFKGWWG